MPKPQTSVAMFPCMAFGPLKLQRGGRLVVGAITLAMALTQNHNGLAKPVHGLVHMFSTSAYTRVFGL